MPAYTATPILRKTDVRYFLDISYRGAAFHGWQRQPDDMSVQQCLEEAFSKALRLNIAVTGAGRTDAGVNARRMVAHADLPDDMRAHPPPSRELHGRKGHSGTFNHACT